MGAWTAWMVAAGIQTYRDLKVNHRAPTPGEFVASGALFGSLSLLSGIDSRLAGILAWGFLTAIILQAGGPSNLVNNGAKGKIGQIATPGGGAQAGAGPANMRNMPARGGVTV